jgi:anti-sigma factor RsiW
MTCREAIDFLASYLDGELPPDVRARFDEHLAECPSCVAYLQTYQATIRLGKAVYALPDLAPPAEMPEELVQAILAVRNR